MLAYGAWKYCGEPKHEKIDFQSVCRAFFFNVSLSLNQLPTSTKPIGKNLTRAPRSTATPSPSPAP
jgi:hypothetical protein